MEVSQRQYFTELCSAIDAAAEAAMKNNIENQEKRCLNFWITAAGSGRDGDYLKYIKEGVIELFHVLRTPCHKASQGEKAKCFCIKKVLDSETKAQKIVFLVGEHKRGECQHLNYLL